MILVENVVMASQAADGLGLFATGYIADGEVVWQNTWAEQYKILTSKKESILYEAYGWYDRHVLSYVIPQDNARYIRCAKSREEANLRYMEGRLIATKELYNSMELLSWYPEYMEAADIARLACLEPVAENSPTIGNTDALNHASMWYNKNLGD